ncbi:MULTISPECIES: S-layer homology domain-containing protein [Thermus]|uniref:S-layer protein-related protein n=1 Tax=Thermus thermophilus (strain ATCC 27634 / DSM 579 / HB8) TaxID=300852 RepID=Q5SH66_THET8|nr:MULTISPECIES: S-layer homology domain-containing protein [Thermus]QZY58432.1 S-layer homology domain-containing protein [Thermus thermophilus]BAD71687.1 S-layer protein-related protein [Thermus thermophilus HB8]BDA38481.1 S-layer protein [Thermus thermophilus]BDE46206.1 S-layer protein [Thermus thermophilus]HAH39757.1 S-layer protein [Thermus sp.]
MKQLRYLLVLSLVGGTLSLSQSQDAPPSPWAEEAVRILVAKGVFIGYPDGSFRWREPMTRQEAALALYRLLAAYGLDRLSPEEVDRLLKGVEALQKDLEAQARSLAALKEEKEALETRVRELEAKPGADPEALEALRKEKDDLARRVQALEEALKVLEAAQKALEAKRLEENLKGTEASLKTLEERLKALEARPQADPKEVEALRRAQEELKGRLEALEKARSAQEEALRRLEEALKDLPEATRLAQEAQDRLQALEPRLQRAEEGLEALENRVRSLEERLKALEAAQAQDQARLKALEEEVAALKRALTPSRLPLHLGLALYQGDVQRDWHGRLFLGHDALIGPLGLRLAYEAPFAEPAQGLASLDLTFRASYGDLDGYFGVGGGLYLGGPSFGQLLVGAGFRLVPHLSLFLEGHQRYLFDSQASQRSTIAFGLALRL